MKDLALARLFFLGLVPAEDRLLILQQHIISLNEMRQTLLAMEEQFSRSEVTDSRRDILHFQLLTLKYGIDQYSFSAAWYADLAEQIRAH